MEFGHVYDSLETVDFALPQDTARTIKTLKANPSNDSLQVYIGAPKWGQKSWTGIIYPKKTPDNQFLGIYSQHFNTVEFGPTFYMIYDKDQISRWTAQVSDSPSFKFCPKFPQTITHIRRLANAEIPTKDFYDSLAGFEDHLGPLLLQLGDNFSPKSFSNLKAYLGSLDKRIKVSVEVRNKNWFKDIEQRNAFFELLSELGIGTIISDTSGRRDAVHMELTTTDAVIRFVGNNLDPTDYKRMDDWAERIKTWADMGLRSLWFFMHQNDERHVPQACVYLIDRLNEKLGTRIHAPTLIAD
ncbi:DUF72 domain-containing protein [Mucilaginibacter conchicola]|uniref:DUF72 domain-containing protein n=2 Tax=Mucilaginibacter conchicola TaxID=2303333 RepID=A0A372NNN9_9SPHI|nr:DUF72 domain-containing protein [Mucilaginibacter conchicola]